MWINHWNPAIALLIWSKYNITFIVFANNAFALSYYIISYAIKEDASQYQWIINAGFIKNAYNLL